MKGGEDYVTLSLNCSFFVREFLSYHLPDVQLEIDTVRRKEVDHIKYFS